MLLHGTSDSTQAIAGSSPGGRQWRPRRHVLLLLAVLLLLGVLLLLLPVLRPAGQCAVL
jgi:hypothetical protein